jgi:hypothetical protein
MPPEAFGGVRPDRSFDLWSLAVVLFEAAGGCVPLRSDGRVVERLLRSNLRSSGIEAGLRTVLERGLAASTGERFQTAAGMAAALDRIRAVTSPAASSADRRERRDPPAPGPRSPRRSSARRTQPRPSTDPPG